MEWQRKMWRYCFAVVALHLTVVGVERVGGSGQLFEYLSLVTPDGNNDPAVLRNYAEVGSRDDAWLVNSLGTSVEVVPTPAPSPSSVPQSPSTPLPPSAVTTRLKSPLTSRFPASTAVSSHTPTGSETTPSSSKAPPSTTPLAPSTDIHPVSTTPTSMATTNSIPASMSSFSTEPTSQTNLGPSSILHTTPTTSTVPSHSPKPSQDLNFQLILYTVPPLGFVVIVAIALFLVLCIHRYRKHRRYRHHLQMPLEEMDSSSEGDGSDQEVNEEESQEAAFVVTHGKPSQPILAFEET